MREDIAVAEFGQLFEEHKDTWRPDAIHRAKSIGAIDQSYQLDFVDVGLLPALEGEIHNKLHRLLVNMLAAAAAAGQRPTDARLLFRVVFRLLAAKVLQDRGHPAAAEWEGDELESLLHAIGSYYELSDFRGVHARNGLPGFRAAWECLRRGISFANISSDDLAFVYENTLVTPEARKKLGTHSTPRQLAEYAVTRMGLHTHRPEDLRVYEPFAGAGTFLVSALRHIRDLLPMDWSDAERHEFLIRHLAGDEIDSFACEVATLSLILADYPNRNGWRVEESDLFVGRTLEDRLSGHNVVLCNPPFQDFTGDEREQYGLAKGVFSKPVEVLGAVVRARPLTFAFVLPRTFIRSPKFGGPRKGIEEVYSEVDIVELPDRVFQSSGIESALVIAREPRRPGLDVTSLWSAEVADRDRLAFLRTGRTTSERQAVRRLEEPPTGELWVPPLGGVWEYLDGSPRLGDYFEFHRGMEWVSEQDLGWSKQPAAGHRRGLHSAKGTTQFVLGRPVWLDCRPERVRGKSDQWPWERRKLVVNAGRLSRGAWRVGAALDDEGLVLSQQFFGLWPLAEASEVELLEYMAIVNGPVANAFLGVHSPAKGIRITDMRRIPVPASVPREVGDRVAEYVRLFEEQGILDSSDEEAERLLAEIDAAVLGAYDLPLRLERELLRGFRGQRRPVGHAWRHWDERDSTPGLTVAERMSNRFDPRWSWIRDVLKPVPQEEAELLRTTSLSCEGPAGFRKPELTGGRVSSTLGNPGSPPTPA